MSQQNDNGLKTFTAGEALEAFRHVKMSSGTLVYADSDDRGIGITQEKVANAEMCTVKLITRGKTFKATAGEAFALGASLYSGADGKVVDTDPGSGTIRFEALEAATADGDIVEVIPV